MSSKVILIMQLIHLFVPHKYNLSREYSNPTVAQNKLSKASQATSALFVERRNSSLNCFTLVTFMKWTNLTVAIFL